MPLLSERIGEFMHTRRAFPKAAASLPVIVAVGTRTKTEQLDAVNNRAHEGIFGPDLYTRTYDETNAYRTERGY